MRNVRMTMNAAAVGHTFEVSVIKVRRRCIGTISTDNYSKHKKKVRHRHEHKRKHLRSIDSVLMWRYDRSMFLVSSSSSTRIHGNDTEYKQVGTVCV